MWQHKTFFRVEVPLKLPQVLQALVVTIDRIEIKCFRQKKEELKRHTNFALFYQTR